MATTTVGMPDPAPAPQQSISTFGRIVGVFFSPKATFEDIARRPSWLAPFLILMVLTVAVSVLIGQKTDWRNFFERQMAQNSRFDNMAPDQKEQILESQIKWTQKLTPLIGPVGLGVTFLVICLIYWGAFNLLKGAGLRFGQSWGITVHAFVPALISSVLAIVVLLIKQKGDVDPEHFLATSLAAYLPETVPKWLDRLGQSLELFWIWSLALIAIGFAAANPRKVKIGSAFGIAFGLWLIWVFCRVGWAAL